MKKTLEYTEKGPLSKRLHPEPTTDDFLQIKDSKKYPTPSITLKYKSSYEESLLEKKNPKNPWEVLNAKTRGVNVAKILWIRPQHLKVT